MAQYIDKAAVVAEIERIKKEECPTDSYEGRCKLLWFEQFLSFIDTLEVKEVDDEKCKEYDKALSIAKAWYKSSDSSAQERNVARMIMGDKVREEL